MKHHKPPPSTRTTIEFDFEAYLPFLEDDTISENDKRKLIETVWSIVLTFVDLGYGMHPVQHVLDAQSPAALSQENPEDTGGLSTTLSASGVEFKSSVMTKFVTASANAESRNKEGVES